MSRKGRSRKAPPGPPAITLTFGDQAENHAGMQKIGSLASEGFTIKDLKKIQSSFEEAGCECERVDLLQGLENTDYYDQAKKAEILIIRSAIDVLIPNITNPAEELMKEQTSLEWDTHAKMRGRVVNKRARYNLCYGKFSQEPDYSEGRGTVVNFKDVPLTSELRKNIGEYVGSKGKNLQGEGNLYYDSTRTGIGFHGDSERRKVVALRLGESIPLVYSWFLQCKSVGHPMKLNLQHGDLYIMSEKAVGFDWKRRKVLTLRHAAGCEKYTTLTK